MMNGNKNIFEYPDDSINLELLEKYLQEAHEGSYPGSHGIETIRRQRVADFDPDNPEWEDVAVKYTVAELRELYKEFLGVDFKPKKYQWNTRTGKREEIFD